MPIRVYDTSRRDVVELEPRDQGRIGIYCCGMTTYNYAHIGNLRTIAWFEMIARYLRYRGFDVTFVMNYTDVDDKIIERARIEGLPPEGITAKYERAFEEDLAGVGAAMPDILCRATEHIDDMIKAIEGLVEKGNAYQAEGSADVFFAVESFPSYGKLSGRSLDDMRAGERIEPHPGKRHPLDFALWKAAKEGEPAWPSPWGPGRPGWHIECSVMSTKYLGMGFDVHGGATDLIFPHHENEIAQAEALEETEPFSRYWLHAGLVQMETEKMSKSLGNVALAKEVLKTYPGEAVRYWMLSSSYRSQAVFSEDSLDDALAGYERLRMFLDASRHALGGDMPASPRGPARPLDGSPPEGAGGAFVARFLAAMDDDFNSSEAMAVIHDLVREGNRRLEAVQGGDRAAGRALTELVVAFLELTSVLGFRFEAAESSEVLARVVEYVIELRDEARSRKEFDRADAMRAQLLERGIVLEDTAAGTRWRVGGGGG